MKPNVKKYAKATLVSLIMMFVVQIVGVIGFMSALSNGDTDAQGAGIGVVVSLALGGVLNIAALVFSALFTWGRNCGTQQSISAMTV